MKSFQACHELIDSALALVAALKIRSGGYADEVPFEPPSLRRLLFIVLILMTAIEAIEALLGAYFIVVVLRAQNYISRHVKNVDAIGGGGWTHELNVAYTNHADAEAIDDHENSRPATARI